MVSGLKRSVLAEIMLKLSFNDNHKTRLSTSSTRDIARSDEHGEGVMTHTAPCGSLIALYHVLNAVQSEKSSSSSSEIKRNRGHKNERARLS